MIFFCFFPWVHVHGLGNSGFVVLESIFLSEAADWMKPVPRHSDWLKRTHLQALS